MLGWRKSMQWNVSWWTGWNWCRVSATRCYFCKAHRGLEQNRPQRFSTSGGPRGSGEREATCLWFRLLHVCGPSSHLTHRSPRLCFSPPLQIGKDLVSSGRPRKLSYSDGHSSNCTLRLIDMTFACTQMHAVMKCHCSSPWAALLEWEAYGSPEKHKASRSISLRQIASVDMSLTLKSHHIPPLQASTGSGCVISRSRFWHYINIWHKSKGSTGEQEWDRSMSSMCPDSNCQNRILRES